MLKWRHYTIDAFFWGEHQDLVSWPFRKSNNILTILLKWCHHVMSHLRVFIWELFFKIKMQLLMLLKKKNLLSVLGWDRRISPLGLPFVITRQALWCQTVILVTDFSLQPPHLWLIIIILHELLINFFCVPLTLCLLVSSASNLCKQFGPRSGPTEHRAWSGCKLFDTLMIFLKKFSEKYDFEKNQQTTKNLKKLLIRQRVKLICVLIRLITVKVIRICMIISPFKCCSVLLQLSNNVKGSPGCHGNIWHGSSLYVGNGFGL